jgi:hypothetical protein
LQVSIRKSGSGRWNHHYFKLTSDNEFAIPSDVTHIDRCDELDVKVHGVIPDVRIAPSTDRKRAAADILLEFISKPRPGLRADGAERHDEYLRDDMMADR